MTSTRKPFALSASTLAAACILGACIVGGAAFHTAAKNAPAQQQPATPTAVAVVDLTKLMNGLTELADRDQQRATAHERRLADLKVMDKRLNDLKADLKDTIPPGDIKARTQNVNDQMVLEATLKAQLAAFQRLQDMEAGDMIRALYNKVLGTIESFAQREGYDLVLLDDRDFPFPARASLKEDEGVFEKKRILYARAELDITQRLITIMNNEYSAATPGAPPPAAKPAVVPPPAAPTPPTTPNLP